MRSWKSIVAVSIVFLIVSASVVYREHIRALDERYFDFYLYELYSMAIGRRIDEDNVRSTRDHRLLVRNAQEDRVNIREIAENEHNLTWLENRQFFFIGHRGGNVLLTGENTLETIRKSLAFFSIVELDVFLTSDARLLLYHEHPMDSRSSSLVAPKSLSSVELEKRILGRGWSPTELTEAVNLIGDKAYIVLDIKSDFTETMSSIEESFDGQTLKRLIPQIYHFGQISEYSVEKFASPIFTSYGSRLSTEEIFEQARKSNVKVVTLTKYRFESLLEKPDDLVVFSHAVDSLYEAFKYKSLGVDGFYTKVFSEQMFPEFSEPPDAFVLKHFGG